jgi:hypothetical protein
MKLMVTNETLNLACCSKKSVTILQIYLSTHTVTFLHDW